MIVNAKRVNAAGFSGHQNNQVIPILLTQSQPNIDELEEQLIEGMDKGIKGDYEGAIAVFSRLIAQYPRYAEAYYNRGVAQGKLENDKAAIADYNQALKINSKLAEAYQERGLLWQKQGNKKRVIADLKNAASLYKNEGNQSAYQSVQETLDKLKIK